MGSVIRCSSLPKKEMYGRAETEGSSQEADYSRYQSVSVSQVV